MAGVKAPEWDWTGHYECPVCEERFYFAREGQGVEAMSGWKLQVDHVHDPENPEGVWRAALYETWPRRRRPEIVKEVAAKHAEAKRKAKQAAQIRNASQ